VKNQFSLWDYASVSTALDNADFEIEPLVLSDHGDNPRVLSELPSISPMFMRLSQSADGRAHTVVRQIRAGP